MLHVCYETSPDHVGEVYNNTQAVKFTVWRCELFQHWEALNIHSLDAMKNESL